MDLEWLFSPDANTGEIKGRARDAKFAFYIKILQKREKASHEKKGAIE